MTPTYEQAAGWLRLAAARSQELRPLLAAAHELGYEPSRSQSDEPLVTTSRTTGKAPKGGDVQARSAFRFSARELARASVKLGGLLHGKPHPMDVLVADDALAPSVPQAQAVADRLGRLFVLALARLEETGRVARPSLVAVAHLDRATRCLSVFRVNASLVEPPPAARRRRDLERRTS